MDTVDTVDTNSRNRDIRAVPTAYFGDSSAYTQQREPRDFPTVFVWCPLFHDLEVEFVERLTLEFSVLSRIVLYANICTKCVICYNNSVGSRVVVAWTGCSFRPSPVRPLLRR